MSNLPSVPSSPPKLTWKTAGDSAASGAMAIPGFGPAIAAGIEAIVHFDDIVAAVGTAVNDVRGFFDPGSVARSVDDWSDNDQIADELARTLDPYTLAMITWYLAKGGDALPAMQTGYPVADDIFHRDHGILPSPHTVDWIFNKLGYDPVKKQQVADLYAQLQQGVDLTPAPATPPAPPAPAKRLLTGVKLKAVLLNPPAPPPPRLGLAVKAFLPARAAAVAVKAATPAKSVPTATTRTAAPTPTHGPSDGEMTLSSPPSGLPMVLGAAALLGLILLATKGR